MTSLHVALVHHPVKNRLGETVTTAVTNLDVHDLSRTCRTYGVRRLWLVNPLPSQRELLEPLLAFWRQGEGVHYNPHRAEALELVRWSDSIAETTQSIEQQEGVSPLVVATTALHRPGQCPAHTLAQTASPVLLLLGTGHGLCDEVLQTADTVLQPIAGMADDYNHLPVRAAAAILLDRIFAGRAGAAHSEK